MSYFTATITWSDGMQATSGRLNEIVSGLRLGSQSVDGTTITLTSGVASVGVLSAANLGSDSVVTAKILDENVTAAKLATDAVETAKIKDLNVTGAKLAADTIAFGKTLPADRAAQADMQSETASHFVSPDVLKHHPGIAKARGIVSFVSGTATVTGGYNVTSAADVAGTREVTLAVTMANTDYVVELTSAGSTASPLPFNIVSKTTTKFTVNGPGEGAGRAFSFVVYGQLA